MRLCNYGALSADAEGTGATVGIGTGYAISEGLHGVTTLYTAGADDDGIMAAYLQHSPDGTNWADIVCDQVVPTANATTSGTVATNVRNLLLTIADDTAVITYAKVYLPVGYLRERIEWTSGTNTALAIYID